MYEDPWRAVLLAPFAGLMVAISVIDVRHRRIPNRLIYPAFVIAAAVIIVGDLAGGGLDALDAGIGLVAYGLGLMIIALISPKGMGMGDVKLAGLIGMVLGSIGLDLVAVSAGMGILLGGAGAAVALLAGKGRKSAIPFGPFLAAGAVIAVFVGHQIADAYLNLSHLSHPAPCRHERRSTFGGGSGRRWSRSAHLSLDRALTVRRHVPGPVTPVTFEG